MMKLTGIDLETPSLTFITSKSGLIKAVAFHQSFLGAEATLIFSPHCLTAFYKSPNGPNHLSGFAPI